jgi:hypothetical protein
MAQHSKAAGALARRFPELFAGGFFIIGRKQALTG